MRYTVPRRNREFASWPPVVELGELVRRNAALREHYRFDILGLPFREYARLCRHDADAAARQFAREIAIEPAGFASPPHIATGHQPECIHGGVWIKNFLASRLAKALGGSSLNLIVDNDVPKHLGLVLPVRDGERARQVEAEFATRLPERAFEEYPPMPDRLDRFEREVAAATAGAPFHDAAVELSGRLRGLSGRGKSIGDVVAALRISYERELGVENAELPVSRLAEQASFGAFVLSILSRAREFASAYNDALRSYREAHRVRSQVNPMPDLAVDGDRVETPFWVWRGGESRGRLYVGADGGAITLYSRDREAWRLEVGNYSAAAGSWEKLVASGLKIRPRAITTTVFMRLFVADIFVHGVGGAEYDEVADTLMRTFYRVEPPPFATITATLTLPWEGQPLDASDVSDLKRKVRDVEYNPQVFFDERAALAPAVRHLIENKWQLVGWSPGEHEGRREKWERIRGINGTLKARLGLLEHRAHEELTRAGARLRMETILFSRDYCVFLAGARAAADSYSGALAPLAAAPSAVR